MVDVVMIRTFEQAIIERFAAHSRVPVINGLTNEYHPCQMLADIYTYVEHRGSIRGKTVAWIGDSNNVCNTWLQAAAIFDFDVHVSTPPGYEVTAARAGLADDQPLRVVRRSDGRVPRRRPRDDRRVDEHGLRGRERRRAPRDFAHWQVDADDDAAGEARRAVHASACPRIAARRSPPR